MPTVYDWEEEWEFEKKEREDKLRENDEALRDIIMASYTAGELAKLVRLTGKMKDDDD